MKILIGLVAALLLGSAVHGDDRPRVSVIEIAAGAGVTEGHASIVTEAVSGWLISSGRVVVVDRANLDKVMKEQALQLTGVVSNADLARGRSCWPPYHL